MVKKLIALALVGAAFAGGFAAHRPHTVTVVHTQDDVTSFNDGYMTALYGDGK